MLLYALWRLWDVVRMTFNAFGSSSKCIGLCGLSLYIARISCASSMNASTGISPYKRGGMI